MSYFIYTNIISSLLDQRLVDPGSTLIYVGAYSRRTGLLATFVLSKSARP